MDDEEDVLFQDFLYKLKQPKKGRFSRLVQERWKSKYFVLCCHGGQLELKCYKKKPKHQNSQPKKQICLQPSFKVEKLSNAHNRAFAVELTAPFQQVCLSADQQSTLDMLVFLLQTQYHLRDTITDNLTEVTTESSEAFIRIGGKGAKCALHVSPWGLTLALRQDRSVLAQWPLKSVRYYESSGQGQFTIHAGMVAPMGEGVYVFHTLPGLDNRLYDAVDHFVINTLDRVKPNQRGTAVEIEDYIREFDCLHSLTVVTPKPFVSNSEVSRLLQENWNSSLHVIGATESSASQSPSPNVGHTSSAFITLSSTGSQQSVSSSPTVPPSTSPPLTSNNTNRPLPTPQTPHRYSPRTQQRRNSPRSRGSPGTESRISGRPPCPPPSRSGQHGTARLTKGSPRSSGLDSVDGGVPSPHGVDPHPRRHSNPSSVALRVTHDTEIHPVVRSQLSHDSGAAGVIENNLSSTQHHPPNSPSSPGRNSCPVTSKSPRDSGTEATEDVEHKLNSPVEDWLVSASCEDLSDHMRAVIFHQRHSKKLAAAAAAAASPDSSPASPQEGDNGNNNDPDFIPPPFTNIKEFSATVEVDRVKSQVRDRSQSFDVNAKAHKNQPLYVANSGGSPSLSIRQIRKMVSARTAAKETLRKSLSNPNFLNLGSKEKLYQHRVQITKSTFNIQDKEDPEKLNEKLSVQSKNKSRSLVSLLPSGLRRYLSKESLSHPPSSTSPSPDVRHSRQRNKDTTTVDSPDRHFQRRDSARSLSDMPVKGIRFTENSRSFRKPKNYKRSQSADPLEREHLNGNESEGEGRERCQSSAERDRLSSSDVERRSGNVGRRNSSEAGGRHSGNSSIRDSSEAGAANGSPGSSLSTRNIVVNGVRPLPPKPGWMMRIPGLKTSQSSC
ncbi:serine/threonine-protein kinase fray2-like [Littorina saxatilis]|uniref:IRS-type PTB domain-containing protein n=1 Tax=Littorina saxatilis TaxID=31220 RepID=A0AAN9G4W3_9CAEN